MVDRVVSETTPAEGSRSIHVSREDFVSYPIYRDSGVEWLGEIPAHWGTRQLKRLCTFEYGDSLSGDSRTDGHVDVYGSNGPIGSHNYPNTLGPCLVVGRKGSFGKVNYSRSPVFAIDTTFFVDGRHTDAQLRWLYYLLTFLRLDTTTKDSAIPGLDREDAYAHKVPVCGLSEQRAIAAFLDRETGKIDALVAKKERLIELLQEKRAALISRAVTKGLDPSTPMNDSGVEWLGEIPAHWKVKRLKHLLRAPLQYGANEPSNHIDPDSPRYIRITDIREDGTLWDETFRSTPAGGRRTLPSLRRRSPIRTQWSYGWEDIQVPSKLGRGGLRRLPSSGPSQ